jgi:hypothetical protein
MLAFAVTAANYRAHLWDAFGLGDIGEGVLGRRRGGGRGRTLQAAGFNIHLNFIFIVKMMLDGCACVC